MDLLFSNVIKNKYGGNLSKPYSKIFFFLFIFTQIKNYSFWKIKVNKIFLFITMKFVGAERRQATLVQHSADLAFWRYTFVAVPDFPLPSLVTKWKDGIATHKLLGDSTNFVLARNSFLAFEVFHTRVGIPTTWYILCPYSKQLF